MKSCYVFLAFTFISFSLKAQDIGPVYPKKQEQKPNSLLQENKKTPQALQSSKYAQFITPSNEKPPKMSKEEFKSLPKEKQEFILKNPDKYNLED